MSVLTVLSTVWFDVAVREPGQVAEGLLPALGVRKAPTSGDVRGSAAPGQGGGGAEAGDPGRGGRTAL